MVKLLRQLTPAKINLFLRITGRRSNGYHELDSVIVPISIYDGLDIELRPSAISSSFVLRCDSASVPVDERNLALKAAHAFTAEFGVKAEVSMALRKQIPVGAGMGGGSSDAAAVIRMMAALCRIREAERLAALALRLGADVPFFLDPCPSRVTGIGERIEPIGEIAQMHLLIAVPALEVSTATVFGRLRREQWSGPAPDADVRAISDGRIAAQHLVNDLGQVATVLWPEIGQLKNSLDAAGARATAMTGSGGGVFGIFDSQEAAARGCDQLRSRAPWARIFSASVVHSAPGAMILS
jgi:4-diphosphocytidyl-2-C-methyl-D-erythritol kinase